MAYNEELAGRVREALAGQKKLEAQEKFGGISFSVNGKMCVRVRDEELMMRCEPEQTDAWIKKGARPFVMKGKAMKGWLLVDGEHTRSKKGLDSWIAVALAGVAKATEKKPKKK